MPPCVWCPETRKALEEQYAWLTDTMDRYALGEALACLVIHLEGVLRKLQRDEDCHPTTTKEEPEGFSPLTRKMR